MTTTAARTTDDAGPDGASPTVPVTGPARTAVLEQLGEQVHALRVALVTAEAQWAPLIARVHPSNVSSAVNLAHYWAIRQHDLRGLQQRLASFGLSSLGRSEPHVRATLEAIATALEALTGRSSGPREPVVGFADGPRMLRRRATELFGPEPAERETRIMVTLPSEAASDEALVRGLLEGGMDLARVNCAHDGAPAWASMIAHVRAASAATGRDCRIAMDLAGPKLRTGPLAPGPEVMKLKPVRDGLGRVTEPARCWLTSQDEPSTPPTPGLVVLPVPADWLAGLSLGDRITLRDTRDSRRHLRVDAIVAGGVLASLDHTAYVATGTRLHAPGGAVAQLGPLPPTEQFLTLRTGDGLVLTRDCTPAAVSADGPPHVGCTLPGAFGHIRPGQSVQLDDGKIRGTVLEADGDHFTIRVTGAAAPGVKLRAAKGINLPDTVLPDPALTATDREHLAFVAAHADVVELSFVRTPADVEDLLSALEDLGADHVGVVLKIETAQAFRNLPALLLTVMRRHHSGVMIARGDLASECGYERLAELQEEILWLCEAAHLPVIWATQVLDQMARSGQPSRAEITDAAMGARAECVMLNKGPYIVDAVTSLDDILTRMTTHQDKKNSLMRPLRSWGLTALDRPTPTGGRTP